MAGVFGSVFFRLFDFFPVGQTSLTSLTFVVPKTCGCRRMSFSTSRRQTFSKSNAPRSFANWQWNTNLHQQITEFLGHFVVVFGLDGVN